jgi:hypothetical protein
MDLKEQLSGVIHPTRVHTRLIDRIACEIGMSEATGKDYVSIAYLIDNASR